MSIGAITKTADLSPFALAGVKPEISRAATTDVPRRPCGRVKEPMRKPVYGRGGRRKRRARARASRPRAMSRQHQQMLDMLQAFIEADVRAALASAVPCTVESAAAQVVEVMRTYMPEPHFEVHAESPDQRMLDITVSIRPACYTITGTITLDGKDDEP